MNRDTDDADVVSNIRNVYINKYRTIQIISIITIEKIVKYLYNKILLKDITKHRKKIT